MAEQKSTNKKLKILVGMTGRIDSTIAAYLLKKQGHDVVGIGIVFGRTESEDDQDDVAAKAAQAAKEAKDKSSSKKKNNEEAEVKKKAEFVGVYQLSKVEEVKKICDSIDIPFYAVDATKKYQAQITDPLVGARIGGQLFSPKVHCNKLIFETLIEKMDKLGADMVASGHYAKVIKNLNNGEFNLYVANDIENDQSYLLSQLEQDQLSKILFPLAEMRKQEVEKIKEMINVKVIDKYSGIKDIMKHPKIVEFVEDQMPGSLKKEGPMIEYKNESMMGDHEGIHKFFLGEKEIKTKQGTLLDKSLVISKINYGGGVVYLSYDHELFFKYISLKNVSYSGTFDLTKPIEVFIQTEEFGKKLKGIFYMKNNNSAFIELAKSEEGLLHKGQYVTLFNRSGLGGKIIGGGDVMTSGNLVKGAIKSQPEKYDDDDESEENIDIYEFKF
ncbi:MAG: hypothetical protein GY909_07455 [Oligoflexia bacterium]|nr:hypothetical protein [Oligoflexia bacterium]